MKAIYDQYPPVLMWNMFAFNIVLNCKKDIAEQHLLIPDLKVEKLQAERSLLILCVPLQVGEFSQSLASAFSLAKHKVLFPMVSLKQDATFCLLKAIPQS